MRILLLISDNPGINKTQVMRSGTGSERVKFERIEKLIDLGYLKVINSDHWNAMGLEITDNGKKVVSKIKQLYKATLTEFPDYR